MKSIDTFELWIIKGIVKLLRSDRSYGRNLVSIFLPPQGSVSISQSWLSKQYQLAIGTNDHRDDLHAINAAKDMLRHLDRIPKHGIFLFAGTLGDYGDKKQQRSLSLLFHPLKPTTTPPLSKKHNYFQTEPLKAIVGPTFGFLIMDNAYTVFGTLWGNLRTVLAVFRHDKYRIVLEYYNPDMSTYREGTVPLPLPSSPHHPPPANVDLVVYSRLRLIADEAFDLFRNKATDKPSITGLIVARSQDIKAEITRLAMVDPSPEAASQSGILHTDLLELVVNVVDISYDGRNDGFQKAIKLSSAILAGVQYVDEMTLLERFLHEVGEGSWKCVYGVEDCWKQIQKCNIETLIISDTSKAKTLLEYLYTIHKYLDFPISIVTDDHREGKQFARAFGGIGCLLLKASKDSLDDASCSGADPELVDTVSKLSMVG